MNQEEIIDQIINYFGNFDHQVNDEVQEKNFLLIKDNCKHLNLGLQLNNLISSFINAFESLKKSKQIINDYIYNPDAKGYKVISEKIKTDIKINTTKIMNDIKKEICNIFNFKEGQKEIETKINPIIILLRNYTEEVNKKLEFLNEEIERIKNNPQNETKIKSLNDLISNVYNELNEYKMKYESEKEKNKEIIKENEENKNQIIEINKLNIKIRNDMDELKERNAKTEKEYANKIKDLQETKEQMAKLIEDLQETKEQMAKLIEDLQETKEQMANQVEGLQKSYIQMANQVEGLQKSNIQMANQIKDLKESYIQTKNEITNQINELKNKIKDKIIIIKDLNEESKIKALNVQEKELDVCFLKNSLENLQNKVDNMVKDKQNKQEIQKYIDKQINDKFTQLIEIANSYSFIENRDI